jgi:hypothetical protein
MSKHGEFNIDSWQFQFSTGEDLSEGVKYGMADMQGD